MESEPVNSGEQSPRRFGYDGLAAAVLILAKNFVIATMLDQVNVCGLATMPGIVILSPS